MNKKEICKKLGYHNPKKCLEKLEYLEKNGIENFLKHNFKYDFILSSELFLKKVLEMYGDEEDMKLFKKTKEKLSRSSGNLFINTDFKRISEPIFVLAMMEGVRNISIDKREFENIEEELEYIKNFVKNHYQKNNGTLKIWRNIVSYIYTSDSFDKKIVFDTEGNIIDEVDNFIHSKATIKIKNKEIK